MSRFAASLIVGAILGILTMLGPRAATAQPARGQEARPVIATGGTRREGSRGPVQCEKCHADRQFLSGKAKGPRGDSVLFVPDTLLLDSRHRTLVCADCHAGYNDGYPHVTVEAVSRPCRACHDAEDAAYQRSSHARNFDSKGDAATCVSCHSSHRVLGRDDARSPTYPLNVARLCGSCHDKSSILDGYFDAPADTTARTAVRDFRRSVHGLAMSQAGLTVSATCSDCHDSHQVLPVDSVESTLNRSRVKETCGACHAGVLATYDSSAHGQALASGDTTVTGQVAPVCIECHGGHKVVSASDPAWFSDVVRECGACHQRLIETYLSTYHGKASALGYGIAAKCSDCHTAHSMLPADDPRSSVHPDNLVATCSGCHEGANANFVKYKPHGDPHDRERNPELYWVWVAMTSLLVGVFGFFGIHSLLWFNRLLAVRRARPNGVAPDDRPAGVAPGATDPGTAGASSERRTPATAEASAPTPVPAPPSPTAPVDEPLAPSFPVARADERPTTQPALPADPEARPAPEPPVAPDDTRGGPETPDRRAPGPSEESQS